MKLQYDSFSAQKKEIENILLAQRIAASKCDVCAMRKLVKLLDECLKKINNFIFEESNKSC